MTSTDDNRFLFPAWGVSLVLHGLAVGLAFAFVAQVKPLLPEDVFQWDVALVNGTKSYSKLEQVESVVAPVQPRAKNMLPPQPKLVAEVSQTVTQIEQQIEPLQPIEPKVEAPPLREDALEERMVALAGEKAEPVGETKTVEPIAAAASPEPVVSAPASSSDVPILREASASALPQESTMSVAPVPGHEAKVDNRWLAESLWRRVAELKRYPNSARMNGQEGKVILQAVIRSDGHLADVFVQKSSGYSVLDEAAIEAVKLACPLHMKYAIGKPQIVVSLPIVYSLAN
jgi:periplasmic protein TonB